MIHMAFYKHFK